MKICDARELIAATLLPPEPHYLCGETITIRDAHAEGGLSVQQEEALLSIRGARRGNLNH